MKIASIRISQILGIDELEFEAGQFNLIEAKNGKGKTSVIEAIKSITPGTEDATLLRNGADRGEIVLVLDNGTEIKRRVGVGRGMTVTTDGVRAAKPTEALKAWIDSLSVNPVEFLRARPKDRVNVLLETLPMEADPERLAQIAGAAATVADPDAPALFQIAAVQKALFDDRTGTNRAVKEKEATINQLAATLPQAAAGAPQGSIADLEAALAELDSTREAELARVATKLEGFSAASQDKINDIQKDIDGYQTLIEEYRALIEDRRTAIAAERASFSEISGKAGMQRQITLDKHRDARAPIATQIAALRADADAAVRAQTTRDTIAGMRKQADSLRDDAERMTTAIDALEAYKSELLSALPIPGLEIRDGEIYRDGVIFDRINKAQQVDIAFEVARLRAGELGIVCVDEIESLDSEHLEAIREKAAKADLQLFVTRVSDGEFTVTAA